jgi:integrase
MFQPGGREAPQRYGGTFRTLREAKVRRDWIANELAAMRVPDIRPAVPVAVETLGPVAERWRSSRVDVTDRTAVNHGVDLGRILPALGDRPPDEITAADVASFVGDLHAAGLARESIRKTLTTLAQVFDFAAVTPNPARDRRAVRLPREDRREVCPPTSEHVEAVHRLLPVAYRLPLLVLDTTGMRVGELEAVTWGDVDETEGRWRVSGAVAKTRRPRWVPVPVTVFAAVTALRAREDRDLSAQVFAGFGADRFRTALTRASKAAGVPVFSPHDLRHRRATLWHLGGVPAAEAASWLGHSAQEHLKTYAHATLADRSELNVPEMLVAAHLVRTPVLPRPN